MSSCSAVDRIHGDGPAVISQLLGNQEPLLQARDCRGCCLLGQFSDAGLEETAASSMER